jgi:hypothetical protein
MSGRSQMRQGGFECFRLDCEQLTPVFGRTVGKHIEASRIIFAPEEVPRAVVTIGAKVARKVRPIVQFVDFPDSSKPPSYLLPHHDMIRPARIGWRIYMRARAAEKAARDEAVAVAERWNAARGHLQDDHSSCGAVNMIRIKETLVCLPMAREGYHIGGQSCYRALSSLLRASGSLHPSVKSNDCWNRMPSAVGPPAGTVPSI